MPPYQNGPDNQGPLPAPAQQPVTQPQGTGPAAPAPQPAGNQPAAEEDPTHRYDFFLNPEKPQRKVQISGGLFSNKLLFAGVAVISIFVVLAVVAMLNSGNKPNTDPLVSVAQMQVELVRVAQDGMKNAQSTDLKNFSVTTAETISSAEQQLVAKIGSTTGLKLTDKQLNLAHSTDTDKALAAAVAASTYDTSFQTIMQNDLDSYVNRLEAAEAATPSRSTKALLQSEHDGAMLLEKQLNQVSS